MKKIHAFLLGFLILSACAGHSYPEGYKTAKVVHSVYEICTNCTYYLTHQKQKNLRGGSVQTEKKYASQKSLFIWSVNNMSDVTGKKASDIYEMISYEELKQMSEREEDPIPTVWIHGNGERFSSARLAEKYAANAP